jgi:hypothetical protein
MCSSSIQHNLAYLQDNNDHSLDLATSRSFGAERFLSAAAIATTDVDATKLKAKSVLLDFKPRIEKTTLRERERERERERDQLSSELKSCLF